MIALVFFTQIAVFKTSAETLEQLYESYLEKYQKSYSDSEKKLRFSYFQKNLEVIENLNSRNLDFSLKVGPKADWSSEDFFSKPVEHSETLFLEDSETPEFVDWVKQGKVTQVRNPQNCEASWVYAAVDAIESALAIENKVSVTALSVQQLISCSESFGNDGCTSGDLGNSFKYAQDNVLCTESQYPFLDKAASCKRKFFCKTRIGGFAELKKLNETQIKIAVSKQPVAVTLNVTTALLNYEKGIITHEECGFAKEQAFFTIVGYGSIAGKDFWTIRSHWGKEWGIGGYGLIERQDFNQNGQGTCGVAFSAFVPIVSQ
jgi:cathepsin L/histolysain